MPQNQAAWMSRKGAPLEIGEAIYEAPGPRELTVQVCAVAINPIDWKMQDYGVFIKEFPAILGSDVAGFVEEVGSRVSNFKKGDRVISNAAALVLGKQYAAFQLFLRCPTNVVCKLPASISFEQGAVLPLAINTAGQALFGSGRLELPLPSLTPTPTNDAVFIYSGSSSVGSTAIQLAKAAGCYVITTASEHNFQFCKDVGADQVFDYKGSSWMDDTVEALKGKNFKGAFDTISTETTAKATIELLRRAGHDSQLMMVQPPSEDIDGDFIWAMAILKQNDLARTLWINFLPKALESGKVLPKPDPIVIGKGLEELQKGLDAQRNGVSARKVVVVL